MRIQLNTTKQLQSQKKKNLLQLAKTAISKTLQYLDKPSL